MNKEIEMYYRQHPNNIYFSFKIALIINEKLNRQGYGLLL
jgi:hypothetical protein